MAFFEGMRILVLSRPCLALDTCLRYACLLYTSDAADVYATSKNFAIHSKIRICMDVRDHQRKTVSEIKKVHEMCSLKWKFCTMVEGERKRKENGNKN